jgi:quinol monooxygenase YgiN
VKLTREKRLEKEFIWRLTLTVGKKKSAFINRRGTIMITRMILVNVPQERAAEAERLWKQECAPLMIKQPGCLSEQFLRGRENPGEFISVSTWENQAAIDKYRASEAHKAIQQHTRALMNVAKVEVKSYDVMG